MKATPVDDVVARGRKTIIRRKRMSDAETEYVWRADAELAEYDASQPVRLPLDEWKRQWAFDYRFTDMPARSFAIEDENGRHIGNIMYYNHDGVHGEAEIGISIGERLYWSHGYGTDAVRALLCALFDAKGLKRVYLHTLEWNHRAQKSFQKAGFVPCGTSWRSGHTFVVMEVRREWVGQTVSGRARV